LINTWARKPIPNCDVNAAYAADARLADDKYCPWPWESPRRWPLRSPRWWPS